MGKPATLASLASDSLRMASPQVSPSAQFSSTPFSFKYMRIPPAGTISHVKSIIAPEGDDCNQKPSRGCPIGASRHFPTSVGKHVSAANPKPPHRNGEVPAQQAVGRSVLPLGRPLAVHPDKKRPFTET